MERVQAILEAYLLPMPPFGGPRPTLWSEGMEVLRDYGFLLNTEAHWHQQRTLSDLADLIDQVYHRSSARVACAAIWLRHIDYLVYEGRVATTLTGVPVMVLNGTTVDIAGEDGTMHQSTTYRVSMPGQGVLDMHESNLLWA